MTPEKAFAPLLTNELNPLVTLPAEADELGRMIAELERRIAKELTYAHLKHAALVAAGRAPHFAVPSQLGALDTSALRLPARS